MEDRRAPDGGTSAALTAVLVVVVLAIFLVIGYFAWYAPTYRAPETDVRVDVPEQEPDVDVVTPPDQGEPGGVGAGPEEEPIDGTENEPPVAPEPDRTTEGNY